MLLYHVHHVEAGELAQTTTMSYGPWHRRYEQKPTLLHYSLLTQTHGQVNPWATAAYNQLNILGPVT